MGKFKIFVASALLALVGALGFAAIERPSVADAQDATTQTWAGKNEHVLSGSVSINTIALLDTAVTTAAHNVRAFDISCSAAGVVTFYDSTTQTGAHEVHHFYVAANTPRQVPENILGPGKKGAVGAGLYAAGINGTLTYTIRVRDDPN